MPTDTETAQTDAETPADADLERAWIEQCAIVWRAADWQEFDRKKTPRTEIFGEKLLSAKNKPTPEQALDELCQRFGLAAAALSSDAFATLRADRERSMDILRDNRAYIAAETRATIDRYYEALDSDGGDGGDEADPDAQTTDLSDFITEA